MKSLLLILGLFMCLAASAAPQVRNVKAFQQYPWGHVCISYEVEGNIAECSGSEKMPILVVTAKDKTTGKLYGVVSSVESCLTGDTGTAEGQHKVIWDIAAQGVAINSTSVVFTVAYEEEVYMVVDLSSGANSSSYPVSYRVSSGGWADEYKTTKLVLRRIEPGSFKMRGSYDVTLTNPFYMGVFEVTQKQYELVMGSNTSYYKGDKRPVENVSYNTIRGSSNGAKWPASSAVDSTSFLGKLRARTGVDFDLPTEAQWEYACRAGTTSCYNNGGDTEEDLKLLGRYNENRFDGKGECSTHTTVGSYQPNAWGLYDMHGNVWELCLDWIGTLSSATDPKGSSSGSYRRVRGGSWFGSASGCTSSYASSSIPSDGDPFAGFRLVRTLSGQ